jgi:hypothetical protein
MSEYLHDFGIRLLEITEGCREDMHEPDEQDLEAFIVGEKLDNAFGEAIIPSAIEGGFQEYIVILRRRGDDEFKIQKFNLATLIALARKGARI